MSDQTLDRIVGRMEGEIAGLQSQLKTMRIEQAAEREKRDAEMAEMRKQLADVHGWMQQAQGSWKTMVGAAAFGAAVVGVLSNLSGLIGWVRGH